MGGAHLAPLGGGPYSPTRRVSMAVGRAARKINWMASTASTDASESAESAESAAMEDVVASPDAFIGRIYRIQSPTFGDQVYVGSTL